MHLNEALLNLAPRLRRIRKLIEEKNPDSSPASISGRGTTGTVRYKYPINQMDSQLTKKFFQF